MAVQGRSFAQYIFLASSVLYHAGISNHSCLMIFKCVVLLQGGNPSSLVQQMQRKIMDWKPASGFCMLGSNATATGCIVPDDVRSNLDGLLSLSLAVAFEY